MTKRKWERADERIPDPARVIDVPDGSRPERTDRLVDCPSREELQKRSEQHDIDQAKMRIRRKVARGIPINGFERSLIADELPADFKSTY